MPAFTGFTPDAFKFLAELELNNEKTWFEPRKSDYETLLRQPTLAFIEALGEHLAKVSNVTVDLRLNGSGSLMRPYRDVRFSKDKRPYKTNISAMLWDGQGKKTQRPAFGFQMEKDKLQLIAGMFQFPKETLNVYREALSNKKKAKSLTQKAKAIEKAGFEIHGSHYKKVPRGYPADHPEVEWLKYAGLYACPSIAISGEDLYSKDLPKLCFDQLKPLAPLYQWLIDMGA